MVGRVTNCWSLWRTFSKFLLHNTISWYWVIDETPTGVYKGTCILIKKLKEILQRVGGSEFTLEVYHFQFFLGITTTVENKLMQVIVLKEAKILESKCDMCNLKILNQPIQILKAVMFNV